MQTHPSMRQILNEQIGRADMVHIHALWEEIQHCGAVTARNLGKPYVITPHGMLTLWSLQQKWLKKTLYMAFRLVGRFEWFRRRCTSR